MSGKGFFALIAPLMLMFALSACEQGVQPGVQSAPESGFRGEAGRVIDVRAVDLRRTRSGATQGTLVGAGVGGVGGAIAGAAIGRNAGSAVLGGALGAVGGAIVGTAVDQNSPSRGIAVTIDKDDGYRITIAQRDDGIQIGDRVIIVYDNYGVARAVRDSGRDYGY
jgi:outer membrane lipoprotein SlyB